MAPFDPYYIWLEIPPDEQPPTPHRLLGIAPDETDKETIREAALQRNAFIRQFSLGEQGIIAERLLNEIAAARDNILAGNVQTAVEAPSPAVEIPIEPDVEKSDPTGAPAFPSPVVVRGTVTQESPVLVVQPAKGPRRTTLKEFWKQSAVIGVSVVGAISVLAIFISMMSSGDVDPVAISLPPNLQKGLVAYYPFNGNARDESGNGHDAIVTGPVLATDRFGNADSTYLFDGVDDVIKQNDATSMPRGKGDFTVSLWANATNIAGDARVFLANDKLDQFQFYIQNGCLEIFLGGSFAISSGVMDWDLNQWYQVATTRLGDQVSIYRNGEILITRTNSSSINVSDNERLLSLGRRDAKSSGTRSSHPWHGKLDNIIIYNRALSAAEVKALYEYESKPPASLRPTPPARR